MLRPNVGLHGVVLHHLVRLGLSALLAGAVLTASSCATTGDKSGGGHRAAPDEPWRATRPAAGPAPEFKLPQFQKLELKNGLTVFVVEEHSLPMIAAAVVVRAGGAQEAAKEAGLANLTWSLIDEGAGTFNNLALANAFGTLGSQVSTMSMTEQGVASVELLKKHADAGLELLATVVRKPTFAQADFDRVRAQLVGELKAREGEPPAIASSLVDKLMYGADHPYGHDMQGTVATLEKLTAARAKKFWSDNAGPKNAALVLTGDITLDEAKALAEKHFGKWSGGPKAPKPPAEPKARAAMKIAFVDVPGAPQTAIRLGRATIARGDPEEAAMIVFNEIVGGSFSSRLNLKLREEKQWTYGCGTNVDRRLGKGPWGIVYCEVQTPNTADAVAEIVAQLDAIKATGATDDEVTRAKEGWVKSLPSSLGLPSSQLFTAGSLFTFNMPVDYYEKLAASVNAVNAEAVKKAAERALVKEDLVMVLVGDKATVEPLLKAKGFTELSIYNRDGSEAK